MVKSAESTDCTAAEIKYHIAQGADVDGADETGRTALIYAAVNNKIDVMKVLVHAGARIDHVGESNWTPLMRAADVGSFQAVRFLLENGADWRLRNADGDSALDIVKSRQFIGTTSTRHNKARKAEVHEQLKKFMVSWASMFS